MIVQNIQVPEAIINAALSRMARREFTAAELTVAVDCAMFDTKFFTSVDGWGMRVADRLIQREKKAGNIVQLTASRKWSWVGEKA